jgi:serine-type D-Ala-D-Ala carboxypeptidase (penicillin-binding protein 5/6)
LSKFVSFLLIILLLFSNQLDTLAAEKQQLDIKSESAVLLDSETGAVLYAKNADVKMYPASLTKIATAIYAIEKGNLNDVVTVSKNAVNTEGTRVYLNEGEKVPLRKLIQGMLINSGNDAAVAIAEHLGGSVTQFQDHLNTFIEKEIGVKNTHFTNPNGLFDKSHYTTALDLAMITNYAMKNSVFAEIFGTKELKWNGQSWSTTLITHHLMLKGEIPYPGISGGKTGYVDESKQTLATTAGNGKLKLTVIEMKANWKKDIYNDTINLLNYGFNNFQHKPLYQTDIFKKGKNEYFPAANLLLTEPINGAISEVNEKGRLDIKNSSGEVIQNVQLKLKKVPTALKEERKPTTNQEYHMNALYGIAIFAIAGVFLSFRKKINRKSN